MLKENRFINIVLFLIIILHNPIWIFWSIGTWTAYFLVLILLIYLYNKDNSAPNMALQKNFIFFVSLFLIFILRPFFFEHRNSTFFILMTAFLCLALKNRYNVMKVTEYLTSYLSIVILLSLPLWLVHTYITPLPQFGIIDLSMMKTGAAKSVVMNNYLFFVTLNSYFFDRFYSMFNEPGVLGTLSAFVLFGNRYNFKDKRNIVILIGAFFTYSMAFYVLTLVGYMLNLMISSQRTKLVIPSLIAIAVITGGYYFVRDIETFQLSVLSRIDQFGMESVDERNSEEVRVFFDQYILSADSILGMGTSFLKEKFLGIVGASYKLFIIEYGLIGFFLVICLYKKLFSNSAKVNYVLLIIFILSFAQRALLFSSWQIVLFFVISQRFLSIQKYERLNSK